MAHLDYQLTSWYSNTYVNDLPSNFYGLSPSLARNDPPSSEKEVPERAMLRNLRTILRYQRPLHTLSSDKLPSEMLRKKIAELENIRRKKKSSKRDEFIVNVPGNTEFLDTPTMPMILIAVGIAIFTKLLMIHDDATAQERLERKMKKLPPGTGTVRMLSKEEWEAIQDIGPQTPYESKYARPNARLRTGDPMHMEDVKDWTIDVLRDGLSRIEECVKHKN